MLAGFFFLLFLTGGNASSSELHDEQKSNHSFEQMSGGNASGLEPPDNYEDQLAFNDTSEELDIYTWEIFERERDKAVEAENSCSFQAVAEYLNLTQNSAMYTMSRPVKDYRSQTWVVLDMRIFAILDMRERDQMFLSYIWIYLKWDNEHIWWFPSEFCGLEHIIVPTKLLWMPDLTIEEMTEKDKADQSPFLSIKSHGWVEFRNDQVLITTCKMHVYKFPFDIQKCNISFKSIMHSEKEIALFVEKSEKFEWSQEAMHTQYEWLFLNQTFIITTVNQFGFNQTKVVYTITMKRRSVLYMVNFLLPVLFFLCLDLASFLISDTGGEKIGFKITVLLAVTVMQLILNEILPASSNRIPLIALYCIGIFSLMLLSLLETILVMYLLEKDSASQDNETDKRDQSWNGDKQTTEGSNSQLTEVSFALEKVSHGLVEMEKAITNLGGRKEEVKPGYWTRVVKKINTVFFICYITAVTVFLASIFSVWFSPDDKY